MRPEQADRLPDELDRFVAGLTSEERMLIVLKHELYEGSWNAMLADLRARLEGRPYIFKLVNRIQEDLRRIEKLMAFEEAHQVNLADCVNLDTYLEPST